MNKYYTRACNFYYGKQSRNLIKKNKALPLSGNLDISFNQLEIFIRKKNKITSKFIDIKDIKFQNIELRNKIRKDIKKITRKIFFFNKPTLMGILNMTPDSFSDGGKFNNSKAASKKIISMINSGAEIIDIGGESTRPGSRTIPSKLEWIRIHKIVKSFKKKYPKILLSIDTRKSQVMKKSIKYKADIINDVSSFDHDRDSIKIVKKNNVWKIIHHMQGTPQTMQINPKYKNVLLEIYDLFENKIKTHFKRKRDYKIILDPGIGFGKNLEHNLMIINKISLFHSLGFPILIGTSRKKFIGEISGRFDNKSRIGGTLSSVLLALSQGVQIFRVHNVEEIKQGILVYKKLLDQ